MGSVTAFPRVARTQSCATLRARHVDGDAFWVLQLSGEADITTLVMLREELAQMVAENRACFVVDLRELTFCDVASANMIRTAQRTAPVTLIGATGPVKRVIELLDTLHARRSHRKLRTETSVAASSPGPG